MISRTFVSRENKTRRGRANSVHRKQLVPQTPTHWVQVRRLTPDPLLLPPMELPALAKSIAPRHWTGRAHFGFSARPDHSIPPVVSIRLIAPSLVSTTLP